MPKQILTIVTVVLFAVLCNHTPTAEAQNLRSRQPLQMGFRWLGQGWSAGYHHQNPGPNTDYYNPYTAHNSMLISRMPGYQTGHGQYGHHSGLPATSYSNYASGSNWNQGHGQSIEPTFVPVDDEDADSEEDESDDDKDFDTDDMPEVSSDSDEPGSIFVDEDRASTEDAEDADFEDSSFNDDDVFDPFDSDSPSGSDTKMPGSGTKMPGSGTKMPGSGTKQSGQGTKATKTGFSTPEPGSFEAMDLQSFLVN